MADEELSTVRAGEAALKVVHLEPDDVVLIGNVGTDVDPAAVGELVSRVKDMLPTVREVFVFAGDIDVDVAKAAANGSHVSDVALPGFVYNAVGQGVRENLVEKVMAAWAQMSPDGNPATPLRSVGDGYINHVDNLARVAALAVVTALTEQP